MSRGHAVIDLCALRHNLQQVRRLAPQARVMAAVKANGYGHGAIEVARALDGSDAFAVASLVEALTLRDAGIKHPLVILGGVLNADELRQALQSDLQLVVHDFHQLEFIEHSAAAREAAVWIKLDTGMHRLGFAPDHLVELRRRLNDLPGLRIQGWMTHFARADEADQPETAEQMRVFEESLRGFSGPRSLANSAGIVAWPASHADWVRPGIMLYGGSPVNGESAASFDLKAVMTLSSRLLSIRELAADEAVGYSGSWTTPERMRIGVVAIGYGDGYPRHAASGTPVLINGRRTSLVGRVSMDLITVDLRGCDDAHEGDEVLLWGEGLPADEVAASASTIAYDLFCGLTSRVKFEYKS